MKTMIFAALVAMMAVAFSAVAQNQLRTDAATGSTSPAYLRVMPAYTDRRVLAANTNEDHTPPAGARWVIFSANCVEWYAKVGGTAAIAAGDVTAGTASTMNPSGFDINGVTSIGLISPTACAITLDFYK
jgi:hypothetical protein